jgi:hypothetical protein
MYTPYAGAAGMLLHINGKFTMGKLKSYLLSKSFVVGFDTETQKAMTNFVNGISPQLHFQILW